MKKLIVSLLLLFFTFLLAGGKTYTLEDCMQRALEHSRLLEQAGLSVDIAGVAYSQALLSLMPEVDIRNQHTWSDGHDAVTAIEASVILLGGGRIQTLKKSKMAMETGRLEMELVRREQCANVATIYLKLLQDKELISMCKSRLSLLETQLEQIQRKVDLQAAVRSDITMVKADITAVKVDLIQAESDFNSGRISICELLEIDEWQAFDVEEPDSVTPLSLDYSVESLPQVLLAGLESDIANSEIGIAKSALWPTVLVNAGIQDKDRYVGLTVDIPVIGLLAQAKTVRMKRLSHRIALSKADETRLAIDRELKTAISELESSYDKYLLLKSEHIRYEEIVADVRRKYELGAATYFDCKTAMSGMFQAQARMLQSKYEYLLGLKVLQLLLDSGE